MVTNAEIMMQYRVLHNIPDTMPLLTFGNWKKKGYKVKAGEKAKHKVTMWATNSKKLVDDSGEPIYKQNCYMRLVYLFEPSQVEKIKK